MIKKIATVLFFIGIIAFASIGVSFAQDREVYFSNINYNDNDDTTKNIGHVTAYTDQFGDLIVSVSDAYPHYEAYVYFTINYINNTGNDGVWIKTIVVTNSYPSAMDIKVTYPDGTPIPDYTPILDEEGIDAKLTIEMKDGAEQWETYSFEIDIQFTDEPP